MNPVLEAIYTRRSVRNFTEKPISEADLAAIAEAARLAPSAMNRQLWQFTVVTGPAIRRLSSAMAAELGLGDGYRFYNPAAMLLASAGRENGLAAEDCACALENVFLAAHSLGIGSVWINQLRGNCDRPAIREVLTGLGVPADHCVWGMAALGYPAAAPAMPAKKDAEAVIVRVK